MYGELRRLRRRKALSLSDLAEKTGLSRVTINRIENGKQIPRPGSLRKLAAALEVNVEVLTSDQTKLL